MIQWIFDDTKNTDPPENYVYIDIYSAYAVIDVDSSNLRLFSSMVISSILC